MGIWETFTDLVEAATPWSTAEAEAPVQEEQVWDWTSFSSLPLISPLFDLLSTSAQ